MGTRTWASAKIGISLNLPAIRFKANLISVKEESPLGPAERFVYFYSGNGSRWTFRRIHGQKIYTWSWQLQSFFYFVKPWCHIKIQTTRSKPGPSEKSPRAWRLRVWRAGDRKILRNIKTPKCDRGRSHDSKIRTERFDEQNNRLGAWPMYKLNKLDNPTQSDLKPNGRYVLSHDKDSQSKVFSKSPR